ncbi:MAG: DUF4272 domain-containing protein [Asticcacaulis sp.]|nr:DUF4272 domain-containing protein [Asticcacaulis sp.]
MAEAEERYERSVAVLKSRSIPFLASLPLIETEAEITLRSPDEIMARVRCLVAVAKAAKANDVFVAKTDVARWGLEDDLSPREKAFVDNNIIGERDRINFSWQIEAVVPLIWARGLHDDLYFPDKTADATSLITFLDELTTNDIAGCEMRPAAEILDEADLIYRLHWATRQSHLDGVDPPACLVPGIVVERHQALNWLISYEDNADWDEVTTDT